MAQFITLHSLPAHSPIISARYVYETHLPMPMEHLVTVIVEEDQINTPVSSNSIFIRQKKKAILVKHMLCHVISFYNLLLKQQATFMNEFDSWPSTA